MSPESQEGEALKIALLLVKSYEDEHYPIPMPDPIEAIKLKMQEKGLKNKDLVGILGSKSYISQVLNRKKPLTVAMMRFLNKNLGIPAEVLLS